MWVYRVTSEPIGPIWVLGLRRGSSAALDALKPMVSRRGFDHLAVAHDESLITPVPETGSSQRRVSCCSLHQAPPNVVTDRHDTDGRRQPLCKTCKPFTVGTATLTRSKVIVPPRRGVM